MDGEHFDSLVKRLTQTRLTRWEALRGVLASAVGAHRSDPHEDIAAKKQGGTSKAAEGRDEPSRAPPGSRSPASSEPVPWRLPRHRATLPEEQPVLLEPV